jgi:hypothetical protein
MRYSEDRDPEFCKIEPFLRKGSVDSVSEPIPNRANVKTDTKIELGEEEYNKNLLFNRA